MFIILKIFFAMRGVFLNIPQFLLNILKEYMIISKEDDYAVICKLCNQSTCKPLKKHVSKIPSHLVA